MTEDTREAVARRRRAEGDRVRQIREATGEKQGIFAVRLTAEAMRQGMPWATYDNTAVSRLETGLRAMTLDDVHILAAVDPKRRGKLWIAWGEEAQQNSTYRPPPSVPLTPLPAKGKAAPKRGRAS